MTATVTLLTDRNAFHDTWRAALEAAGLSVLTLTPDALGSPAVQGAEDSHLAVAATIAGWRARKRLVRYDHASRRAVIGRRSRYASMSFASNPAF